MPHVKERPQEHRGIKSNTHIECGLIIYDGEFHNVGIHWLLRVGGKGRKKVGFKFSIQEKKTIIFPSLPNHLRRISLLSHKAEHTQRNRSHSAHLGHYAWDTFSLLAQPGSLLILLRREGVSAPPLAHLSVLKVEQLSCKPVICDRHTVMQQEQAVELGLNISILISPFCKTLQRLLKGRRTQEGMTML